MDFEADLSSGSDPGSTGALHPVRATGSRHIQGHAALQDRLGTGQIRGVSIQLGLQAVLLQMLCAQTQDF